MLKYIHILFLVLSVCFFVGCKKISNASSICGDTIVIDSPDMIDFSKNEKKVLCGDRSTEAWREIPLTQAKFTLEAMLKNRAYFDLKTAITDGKLYVSTGDAHTVKKVNFIGAPFSFEDVRYIAWREKTLTSATLDTIEQWTIRRLKALGYACAEIELKALTSEDTVDVFIKPGKKYSFPEINYDETLTKYLNEKVLKRFYAFKPGDIFNGDLLDLSSTRTEISGVINHSYFLTQCDQAKLTIKQEVKAGSNRLLKIGVGASTEEFPILKIGWKNTRIGKDGSSVFADFYASQINQNIRLGFEWHAFKANRWYMQPSLEARRVRDVQQKFLDLSVFYELGARLDSLNNLFSFKFGPGLLIENNEQGPFTGPKQFGILRSSLEITSHDFEIYLTDPRRGHQFNISTSSIFAGNLNTVGAQKIKLSGTKLWNMYNYGPPKYVAGIRFGLESVLSLDSQVRGFIPQHYLQWLGGDNSLRGFSRRELPNNDLGALSSFFVGGELRFVSLLATDIDPFIFLDAGMIGNKNFGFDSTLYSSPGLGLRYDSFIGTLRATAAHGVIFGNSVDVSEHLQFFISLGREF